MRVIGGRFRSRRLKFPKTKLIRPATDRLKETIFDTLGQDLSGERVLDLFAGCGSLGIEALSRGARAVTFVDSNPVAIRYISENLKDLGLMDRAEVLKMDAIEAVQRLSGGNRVYETLFIDPPYNQGLVKKTLLHLVPFDILARLGKIVIEHTRQEELPPVQELVLERTKRYGITCLSFLYKRS